MDTSFYMELDKKALYSNINYLKNYRGKENKHAGNS